MFRTTSAVTATMPASAPQAQLATAEGHHLQGTQITIELAHNREDGQTAVTFAFNPNIVAYIKQLPLHLRQWNPAQRAWLCPPQALAEIVSHFKAAGMQINYKGCDPGLMKEKKDMVAQLTDAEIGQRLARIPAEIWDRLYPYQQQGVQLGVQRRGRLMLNDEPGLGKTAQAIMIAATFQENWPLLIICPSQMRLVWQEQLQVWLPEKIWKSSNVVTIMNGADLIKKVTGPVRPSQITVVSYDMAQKLGATRCREHSFIICDESHMLKSNTANRTRFLAPIIRSAEHALLLSGTPMPARPMQMFSQIEMVRRGLFGSRDEYGERYCGGIKTEIAGGVFEWVGSSNLDELNTILKHTIMVRRLKCDVLKDLPDKLRRSITVELDSKSQEELLSIKAELGALDYDPNMDARMRKVASQNLISQLHRATGRAKIAGTIAHLCKLLETGESKVLVFAHHAVVLDALEEWVKSRYSFIRIDGNTPPATRKAACNAFQTVGKVRVALLSITAAGTGITLTKASVAVFAELVWSPADLVQAEDRAHRVGQMKALQVHYMVAQGPSADEMMWRILQSKLNVVGQVVDGNLQGSAAGLRMTAQGQHFPATPEASRPVLPSNVDHTPLSMGNVPAAAAQRHSVPNSLRSEGDRMEQASAGTLKRSLEDTTSGGEPRAKRRLYTDNYGPVCANKETDPDIIDLTTHAAGCAVTQPANVEDQNTASQASTCQTWSACANDDNDVVDVS